MWAQPALHSLCPGRVYSGLALLGGVGRGRGVVAAGMFSSPAGVHFTLGRPNLVTTPGKVCLPPAHRQGYSET